MNPVANGKARPIPKNGDMRVSGYTHDGPCEVWLDDKMVAQGDNCHNDFPAKKHCIDYSSCKGTCVLHWYWLAERFVKNKHSWQVYKACVPLTTGGQPQIARVVHFLYLTFFRYIYEKNVGVPLSGEDTNEIVDVDADSGVCLRT
ncbi:unnamed protein product [Peronospora farinosa]|uniref:Uncharacterized protein n=1 Tax=Peronospora farinosa TaxID=134698 RepID=A0AAV0UKJ8_9STRA|nr:unnamed protein product [Peronospora farinosa]